MIRVAVVEDEEDFQKQLSDYLNQFERESGEKFQITLFGDGMDVVDEFHGNFDVILMDIQMKFMDGMEAARKIREIDQEVLILFITNMAKYAIKGYEVDAFDFVLKPISYPQFSMKMKKVVAVTKRKAEKKYLMLPVEDKKKRVCTDEIIYIEVQGHYLHVVTEDCEYHFRYSMKVIEQELAEFNFVLCNQSYLVNLKHVTGIEKDSVRLDQYILPISRPKKKMFLKAVSDYIEGGYR